MSAANLQSRAVSFLQGRMQGRMQGTGDALVISEALIESADALFDDKGVHETERRSLDTARVPSCFLYEVVASDMGGELK